MDLSIKDIRKAVKQLKSMELRCPDHKPEDSIFWFEDGYCIKVTCKNCNFVAFMHPEMRKNL